MSQEKRLRIGVVRGGPSSEYEVSLKTGKAVLANLSDTHLIHDIFIDKKGVWHMGGVPVSPTDVANRVDVIFNALHGEYGEDGKVQRELESLGVAFTGSRSLASAIAMNKAMTKERLKDLGIKMARHRIVQADEDADVVIREIFQSMFLPLVVKPASSGSSLGVSIVNDFRSLAEALNKAFEVGDTALVEEYVKGREASCGVVDNFRGQTHYVLPPTEIRAPAKNIFFDYDAKYSGESQEICPGNFTKKEKDEIQRVAQLAHKILGLRHYSRSDFIVSPKGVYFLEVNTLPGFTEESILPKSLDAVGSSFAEFLEHVVDLAMERNK